jgi:hypothetical protein
MDLSSQQRKAAIAQTVSFFNGVFYKPPAPSE